MFKCVKCEQIWGYYLRIWWVKCGGADVENQYHYICCRIHLDGLLYCYTPWYRVRPLCDSWVHYTLMHWMTSSSLSSNKGVVIVVKRRLCGMSSNNVVIDIVFIVDVVFVVFEWHRRWMWRRPFLISTFVTPIYPLLYDVKKCEQVRLAISHAPIWCRDIEQTDM